MDVTCVVNNGETSNQRVVTVQRQCINMDGGNSHAQKCLGVVIVFQGLQHYGWGTFHERLQCSRNRNRVPLRVVDCKPGEVFAVGKLLDGSLQSALCVPLKIVLDVAGETLSQHLRAPVQIPSHLPSGHYYLVRRSTQ